MNEIHEIDGRLLTRNWILNLVGQTLPLLVALITIPYVIRGLGTERFGVLSIAWVLLGYLGLFDLGMGRATTKFVAECLRRHETHMLPALMWTSVGSQLVFGCVGALLAVLATPSIVYRFLNMSPALAEEARSTFLILAGSLPIVLAGNAFRGFLEAAQRFDIVNYIKVPANISIFVLPTLALPFGLRLSGVVFLLVLARLIATLSYLLYCFKLFPSLRSRCSFDVRLMRALFIYGGWVTVSNVVGPLLTYMDRFFVGSLLSMAAVGYYTAPYEAMTKALVFPGSLVATLFPVFSAVDAGESKQRLEDLCARSLKSLLLVLGPVLFLVVVFARQALLLWLGDDFANKSTLVLQILAVGVLINSLAYVPFTVLQGLGRPDLTAKLHLLELPFYAGLLWFLLRRIGLPGAALAWTLRVLFDAFLLFGAALWLKVMSFRNLGKSIERTVLAVLAFGFLLLLSSLVAQSLTAQALLAGALVPMFVIVVWSYVLDSSDRRLLMFVSAKARSVLTRTK
jgi:O-antigen/teichoic acid export membrane protein